MAVLSATETLKILATGKATLKQLVELEEKAQSEALTPPAPAPKTPEPAAAPAPEPAPAPETPPEETPDEKDLKIKELENKLAEIEDKLKEAQQENINANNGGSEPTFEEQLDEMFKGYRY